MPHLLEIRNLHKRFGQTEVLKGVDCAMEQGEVVCVIGSSGSGKTTMLRCINMLEDFEDGTTNTVMLRTLRAMRPLGTPAAAPGAAATGRPADRLEADP